MSNVFGVIATLFVLGGLLMAAERYDYWPRAICTSAAPYGPHDFKCKFFTGR